MFQVHPRLQTERLLLRPFFAEDAAALSEFAGTREIADAMVSIPHPLSPAMARSVIAANAAGFQAERSVHFAIEARDAPGLIGAVELREIDSEHCEAELSFWIAADCWGHGYATEAAAAVLQHGFEERSLNRIVAYHMLRNSSSGRVLQRIGMKQEGVLRERVRKWGVFEDVVLYAILRSDLVAR